MEWDEHVTEQLPGYALGCLDEDEAAAVAQHLDTCAACRAQLVEFQEVAGRLAFAVPDAAPPSGLKQRLMAQAKAGGAVRSARVAGPAAPSWWERLLTIFQPGARAWGVAALTLALLLIVSNVWWWQRAERRAPGGDMRVIAMSGTGAAPDATGAVVLSPDGEYGTLVVDRLPVLDRAHTYQLWLIRDGQRASGGLFDVSSHGYGALIIISPQPLASYSSFGVTMEPAGGSPGPTGDKVLGSIE